LAGCGGATSIDERWDPDAAEPPPVEAVVAPELPAEVPPIDREPGAACPLEPKPEQFYGYRPVNPLEFWLGSQAALPLSVSGAGYFVSRDREAPNQLRFTREVQLAVAPDGVLVDEREAPLLGYGTSANAGGPCVVPLHVPQFAPSVASSRVSISMNLDPRAPALVFDVAQPDASANFSVSFQLFDSRGGTRTVDVYFARDFVEDNYLYNSVSYHVLVDGGDLFDGTPGSNVEVGAGSLQFTSDGALNIATTPEVCFSFAAVTPHQCITLDFGSDISNHGATGLTQVTAFATESAVYALSVDGNTVGTGELVSVDPYGEVSVFFDNGTALPIGKLALARFAREAALEADAGGRLLATQRSGPAHFGNPLSPGRGSVQIANSDDPSFNPAEPVSPS
jgi:flagellar hook protein FlgE